MIRLGVDIGGTFTDFMALESGSGRASVWKRLTTPVDPSEAVVAGITELLEASNADPRDVSVVVHGTTLVANALIERKGSRVALVATRGHRDAIEIGRELRYDVYDLFLQRATPLVPRRMRFEVTERLAADGTELLALDTDQLEQLLSQLQSMGIEAIAISLMHAYANPAHELAVARHVRQALPGCALSLSSQIAPVMHEYERTSTTVANAYVQPVMATYLERLGTAFCKQIPNAGFYIMLSNGGMASAAQAEDLPIQLVESGPAAGALAACHYARGSGFTNLIAFDMGGTTAKMCVIVNGSPERTQEMEVARWARFKRGSGLPLLVPSVDLIEIGAGGGSIAHMDKLGLLKVGPESAGAEPGPACYDRGGEQPTVTDANLVLGYLGEHSFLGGRMQLNLQAAERALSRLGEQLGLSIVQVARGIHDLVNESMAIAARRHVTERARDPREHALVAFGGSGPVHGYGLARRLKLQTLICPPAAGAASALGCLIAPARVELARSRLTPLEQLEWTSINGLFAELQAEAHQLLAQAHLAQEDVTVERSADIRYVGQGFEVPVGLPALDDVSALAEAFQREYERRMGHRLHDVPIEVVTWRLVATGPEHSVDLATLAAERGMTRPIGKRLAHFAEAGDFVMCDVYDRYALAPGTCIAGPAIVEEHESTAVIGPGASARVDAHSNLVVTLT